MTVEQDAPGTSADIATPPRALWRNRAYMLLWSGQAVSSVGSQMSQVAFPLLALALTGSLAQMGLLGAARVLPYLVLSLPAGVLVDRWDRKRMMLLCDAGRALALGSIPVAYALGRLTLVQLYLVALVEGTLFVFFNLAEVACLPRVVAPAQLPAATAQNEATQSTSYLLGPALGGALFGLGRTLPFLADALSYAASVASLLSIRVGFQGERAPNTQRRLWSEVREGALWLWRHPLIRTLALLSGGGMLVDFGTTLVVIALATRQHASAATIGLILAGGGLGGVAGALLVPLIQRHLSVGQAIAGTQWIWALALPLYLIAPNAVTLGAITAVIFAVGSVYTAMAIGYRLALIPDALQGRVNSVFRLIAFAGQVLGSLGAGLLLQMAGPATTILLALGILLALALLATLDPHLRRAPALTSQAPA